MLRFLTLALGLALYTAGAAGANAADGFDRAAVEALREGSLKKLTFSDPSPVSDEAFTDAAGAEHQLADYAGGWVLVNFWATWCVPCREEMPALDALQGQFETDGFKVLTIATGRNPLPAVTKFFDEVGVTRLPVLLDPRQALARDMAVPALPVSVLIDPDGREVARLIGDADWSGDSATAIVEALLNGPGD